LGTVLRLGAVYGSRIKGNYERLTRALAGNLGLGNLGTRSRSFDKLRMSGLFGHVPKLPFIPIGNGLNRRTLVYDKDVGRAAALAVSHPAAAGRVFNVTDGGFQGCEAGRSGSLKILKRERISHPGQATMEEFKNLLDHSDRPVVLLS
jgi:nucleoside-diphosphate-sugar epimerase